MELSQAIVKLDKLGIPKSEIVDFVDNVTIMSGVYIADEDFYEIRLAYGTRTQKWHIAKPDDRDYRNAITMERFEKIGNSKAMVEYLLINKV